MSRADTRRREFRRHEQVIEMHDVGRFCVNRGWLPDCCLPEAAVGIVRRARQLYL
jgi:hypothetical protein